MRIEDTDLERSDPAFEKDILEGLKWLGIEWDEGPDIGGEYGPYRQSERIQSYTKYLDQLLNENRIYHCFCSEEELEAKRQYQLSTGQSYVYDGRCRSLSEREVEKKLAEGEKFILRFKIPEKKIVFNDLIRGQIEFDAGLIGDFAVAKNSETPLYNFAVVIDDFEMKISHVIRGEDHISNTPKQILVQEALNLPRPEYAHLPLILGSDKTKLSKRHGAIALTDYRKAGYLPETIVNFMAFLGWNPGGDREIYTMPSLIKEFSLERVQKGGAVFNIRRLDYLNGFYIRQKSVEKLTESCLPFLMKAGIIEESDGNQNNNLFSKKLKLIKEGKPKFKIKETGEIVDFENLEKIIAIYQERLKKLSEITDLTGFFFKGKLEYQKDLLKWNEMKDKEIKNSLEIIEKTISKIKPEDFSKENLEKEIMPVATREGERGKVLWPFRAALTGKEASAGPFEIAEILGKEKVLKRIKEAKNLIK